METLARHLQDYARERNVVDAEREVVRRRHEVAHEVRRVNAAPRGIRALRDGVDRTHAAVIRELGSVSGVTGETPPTSQRGLRGA